MSVISYFYLNNINNPFQMCHFLIKFICNKNLTDSDKTFEPTNVPMEDIKAVADGIEQKADDILLPAPQVKKMVKGWDQKKQD
jgi:hypothetical protein